jgi:MFS family permease
MAQADTAKSSLRAFGPALALLSISLLVNYVDRGNLSIAAPLLKKELGISATQLGILLSAFFWTYTALQFAGGWIVGRFEVNLVLAGGYLLWSAATAATGIAQGFLTLLMMRLLLGVGGSGTFAFSQTLAGPEAAGKWTGMQNGLANFAGVIGPTLTGYTVDKTGNFLLALGITAAVSVLGGLAWVLLVGRLEQINWEPRPQVSVQPASTVP